MPKYIPKNDHTPIAVVYKKKSGSKYWMKVFTDLRCPDPLLGNRTSKLPYGCEIIEIGQGAAFVNKYKKKYKI
jgi:hypothetical protein|tara:strand:- start:43 stop:261 length:219 start_codon:yes stop_codon:yes gene_type:complete